VVGRQHQHHRVATELLFALQRSKRDRRCGVAALGLEQVSGVRRIAHAVEHVLGQEEVILVGHDHQITSAAGLTSLDRLLQQRRAPKFHERLREGLARGWP
jgi:hypothetical protein